MRIQVKLSDEMVSKVDSISEQMGVTRSALCAIAIGQYVLGIEKGLGLIDKLGGVLQNNESVDKK